MRSGWRLLLWVAVVDRTQRRARGEPVL